MKIPSLSRIAHFHTCRTKLEMKLKWLKKKSRKRLVYSNIPPPMERCRIKNRMITLEWMWKRLLDVKCPGLSQHLVFPRIEKCGIISKCRIQRFHGHYWTFLCREMPGQFFYTKLQWSFCRRSMWVFHEWSASFRCWDWVRLFFTADTSFKLFYGPYPPPA